MKARAILLVEDNPDDEMLTLRALKKNSIVNEITVAHDGAEALELIFSRATSGEPLPGLILLDLKLPKIDGLEVMRRIRADERTSFIPVVILTGSKLDETSWPATGAVPMLMCANQLISPNSLRRSRPLASSG